MFVLPQLAAPFFTDVVTTALLITSLVVSTALSSTDRNGSTSACPTSCLCGMGTSQHIKGYFATVDCRNAKLTRLPPLRMMPGGTGVLLLRGNAISSFMPAGRDFDQLQATLRDVDLSYNRITELDLSALNGTSLNVLNLNFNALESLFISFALGAAKRLEVLELGNNRIATMERSCWVGLENLQRLNLAGNRLRTLESEAFVGLKSLKILNIDSSQITQIGNNAFHSLANLEMLSLSFNLIVALEANSFSGLENLKQLNLAGNRFETLPTQMLLVFSGLKSINFDANPVRKLTRRSLRSFGVQEISLCSMPSLELIDREAFYDLRKLNVIRARDNAKLVYVDPAAILDCQKMTSLYLTNSSLSVFHKTIAENSRDMSDIDLRGNPLRCDCNVRWLLERIRGDNNTRPRIYVSDDYLTQCSRNYSDGAGINVSADFVTKERGNRPFNAYNTTHLSYSTAKKRANENWPTSPSTLSVARFTTSQMNSTTETNESSSKATTEPIVMTSSLSVDNGDDVYHRCPPVTLRFFPDVVYQELEARLVLDCRSVGLPVPTTHWIFSNRTVINVTSNSLRVKIDVGGTLSIYPVKATDTGRYACVSANEHGSDEMTTFVRIYSSAARVLVQTVGSNFLTVTWSGTEKTMTSVQYVIAYAVSKGFSSIVSLTASNSSTTPTTRTETWSDRRRRHGYETIQLRQYMRSYWITNLEPTTVYEVCMAYETNDDRSFVKIDCSYIQTKLDSVAVVTDDGIYRVASRAVLAAIFLTCATPVAVCALVVLARRHHRRKTYADPLDTTWRSVDWEEDVDVRRRGQSSASGSSGRTDVIKTLAHIPLDHLYRPSDTSLSTSRTSLIS